MRKLCSCLCKTPDDSSSSEESEHEPVSDNNNNKTSAPPTESKGNNAVIISVPQPLTDSSETVQNALLAVAERKGEKQKIEKASISSGSTSSKTGRGDRGSLSSWLYQQNRRCESFESNLTSGDAKTNTPARSYKSHQEHPQYDSAADKSKASSPTENQRVDRQQIEYQAYQIHDLRLFQNIFKESHDEILTIRRVCYRRRSRPEVDGTKKDSSGAAAQEPVVPSSAPLDKRQEESYPLQWSESEVLEQFYLDRSGLFFTPECPIALKLDEAGVDYIFCRVCQILLFEPNEFGRWSQQDLSVETSSSIQSLPFLFEVTYKSYVIYEEELVDVMFQIYLSLKQVLNFE